MSETYEQFQAQLREMLEAKNVSVCINHADHMETANISPKCGFCDACYAAGNGVPCPCGCEGHDPK